MIMKLKNVIRLVKQFKNENYEDLVGALVVYEIIEDEFLYELDDMDDKDLKTLKEIYYKFMKSEIPGLLNEDLKDIIREECGE